MNHRDRVLKAKTYYLVSPQRNIFIRDAREFQILLKWRVYFPSVWNLPFLPCTPAAAHTAVSFSKWCLRLKPWDAEVLRGSPKLRDSVLAEGGTFGFALDRTMPRSSVLLAWLQRVFLSRKNVNTVMSFNLKRRLKTRQQIRRGIDLCLTPKEKKQQFGDWLWDVWLTGVDLLYCFKPDIGYISRLRSLEGDIYCIQN